MVGAEKIAEILGGLKCFQKIKGGLFFLRKGEGFWGNELQ